MNAGIARLIRSIDLAGTALCCALVAALIFGGIIPLLHHRGDSEARRKELLRQRQRVEAAKASLASLEGQLAAARSALTRNRIHLEDANRINHRLAHINELAAGRGLHVEGVEPGNVIHGIRYQTIDMKLAGEGGYLGCLDFLRDMHDQFPDMAVTAFRLTGNPQEEGRLATFSFELRWYASPAQATASAQ